VVRIADEEDLRGEDAVDERPEQRVREDPRVAGLEPEHEDAVKGDRQCAEDR
jgi:hypothetical protein